MLYNCTHEQRKEVLVMYGELLSAISNMLDEKLDKRFAAFEQKLEAKIDTKIDENLMPIYSQLKDMNNRLDNIENRLDNLENRLDSLENRLKKLEVLTENVIIPRLQNIEVCYMSTFERYRQ